MSVQRQGAGRSSLFISALLLSTAIAAPAFAQVEQVIVTAQRKSENVQNVPIAITAFTAQDLAAHQITMAKDLQFATPNVTYTKTNFSGDDFTIRGIGNDVITGGGESGVAVSFDNIYLAGAVLDVSSVYDLDQIAVLEGPQSTLYGRGATAGTVNIIPAKPDLEQAFVTADFSYGNYNSNEDRVTVNMPIVTDELGLRVAADREYNTGWIQNAFNNTNINGNNTYSFRGTLRWTPTDATTIDFVAQSFHKDDSTMRAQRQQCDWDPSGTLGCLPNGLANDGINENAFFSTDLDSKQAFTGLGNELAPFIGPLAGLFPGMGIVDLSQQAPKNVNPSGKFTVDTDVQPTWDANDTFMALNGKQKLTNWLDFEVNAGYDHGSSITLESYNNTAPQALNQTLLGTYGFPGFGGSGAEGNLYEFLDLVSGGSTYPDLYNLYLASHPGELPASGVTGLGLNTKNIAYFTPSFSTYDEDRAEQQQYSIDARLQSHMDGPFNFLLGAFYLRQQGWGDYFVSSGAQGYGSVALGSILGLLTEPGTCFVPGCVDASAFYDNSSPPGGVTLKSKSIYGETYYDIVPDLLKLTLGARWTDDFKSQEDRITLFNNPIPIGIGSYPTSGPLGVPYQYQSQSWDKITGRAVLDYTPKLDFTDQTLIYASYGRGYKAGGFNPGLSTFCVGCAATYAPEGIDAFEVGTKNALLSDTLQANWDAWYYNYEGLQISQILDNDSINANVNSRMFGSEGQLNYVPDEHWMFSFNVGYTNSKLGNTELVDPRNPTAGASNAVLIKDDNLGATAAQNCAVYLTFKGEVSPADNAALNAELASFGLPTYSDPPGGAGQIAQYGIPLANYGSCNPALVGSQALPGPIGQILLLNGYSLNQPGGNGNQNGVLEQLKGNENPNSPPWTLGFGVQYTFNVGNDYTLVPRVDFYYQTQMWGRVFEDPADRIQGYTITNAQIQLNAPDNVWFVQAYMKNVFNAEAVTGEYLTSSSSGLYTNQFLQDPRMYGVRLGIHF